jgi:hypothetical protein
LDLGQGPPAEIFLVEEPETPEDAPYPEVEILHQNLEITAQTAAPTPSSANHTTALKEVRVVERRVLVVQIAKDEAPDRITRKIHHLHGWLGSHPGDDQFAFQFFAEGRWREYVFPNESVQISQHLLDQLDGFLEKDSFSIRKERFEIQDD